MASKTKNPFWAMFKPIADELYQEIMALRAGRPIVFCEQDPHGAQVIKAFTVAPFVSPEPLHDSAINDLSYWPYAVKLPDGRIFDGTSNDNRPLPLYQQSRGVERFYDEALQAFVRLLAERLAPVFPQHIEAIHDKWTDYDADGNSRGHAFRPIQQGRVMLSTNAQFRAAFSHAVRLNKITTACGTPTAFAKSLNKAQHELLYDKKIVSRLASSMRTITQLYTIEYNHAVSIRDLDKLPNQVLLLYLELAKTTLSGLPNTDADHTHIHDLFYQTFGFLPEVVMRRGTPVPPGLDAASVTQFTKRAIEYLFAREQSGRRANQGLQHSINNATVPVTLSRSMWRKLLRMSTSTLQMLISRNNYYASMPFTFPLTIKLIHDSGEMPRTTVAHTLASHLQNALPRLSLATLQPDEQDNMLALLTGFMRAVSRDTAKKRKLGEYLRNQMMSYTGIVDWLVMSKPRLTAHQRSLPYSWWVAQANRWHDDPNNPRFAREAEMRRYREEYEQRYHRDYALQDFTRALREAHQAELAKYHERDYVFHPDFVQPFEHEGVTCTPLKNAAALESESNKMGHCVRGYDRVCADGTSRIWHLKGEGQETTLELVNRDDPWRTNSPSWTIHQQEAKRRTGPNKAHKQAAQALVRAYVKAQPDAHGNQVPLEVLRRQEDELSAAKREFDATYQPPTSKVANKPSPTPRKEPIIPPHPALAVDFDEDDIVPMPF